MAEPPDCIPEGVLEIGQQFSGPRLPCIVLMRSLVQLMRALLLSTMHPSVLTRSLVAVTVWHISTTQLIMVGFNIPGHPLLLPL